MLFYNWLHLQFTVHDGDDPGTTPPPETTVDPGTTTAPDKSYTELELQEIVKRERKQFEDRTKDTVKQLELLQRNNSLSEKERVSLKEQIESLQNSLLTKEQIAAKEQEKLRRSHKEELTNVTAERDTWKTRYVEETIRRELIDAAATEDAYNVQQVLAILRPSTRLVEDVDEEQTPKGTFTPKVKLRDEEGVELELTAKEAVKRMKEMPDQYGNLFKNNVTPGLGLGGGAKGGTIADVTKMTPQQYREHGRKALGITPQR